MVLVGVIVVCAAVASVDSSVWAPLRVGRPDSLAILAVVGMAGVVGVVAALGAARIPVSAVRPDPHGAPGPEPRGRARLVSSVPVATVVLAVVALTGISHLEMREPPPEPTRERTHPPREGQALTINDDRDSPVRPNDPLATVVQTLQEQRRLPVAVAAIIWLMGLGGALAWWWFARRPEPEEGASPRALDAEAARGTVQRSIAAMLADDDPRTAIIGAYARLLEGMAAAGVPRHLHEGPVEHLRRALGELNVPQRPLGRLVRLFEVARFSEHALTDGHRAEALEALREVAMALGDPGSGTSRRVGAARHAPAGTAEAAS